MENTSLSPISRDERMRGTVIRTDDPKLEGRIGVMIPKLILKSDPSLTEREEISKPVNSGILANSKMQSIIKSSLMSVNYIWCRPVFRNEHLVPYKGQVVYCFFEDGDPNKPYYENITPTLDGQVTPMDKVKQSANRFDPVAKPLIKVIKEFSDGTIIYYDENDNSKRFAITYKNNHSISINLNDNENSLELITNSNHKFTLDQKNQNIKAQTSEGHILIMDDANKKIAITTIGGHSTIMDDNGKNISIKTTGGHSLNMDDNSSFIDMKTTGGNEFKMDDTGKNISLKTTSGHTFKMDDEAFNITSQTAGGTSIVQDDTSKTITATAVPGGGVVVVNPTGVIFGSTGIGKVLVTPEGVFVN
jgi:hypothetical protein